MTMNTVRERARAAQAENLTQAQAESSAAALAKRVYDEIDGLTASQRGLLVTTAAGYAKGALENILHARDITEAKAVALIGLGLLGTVCYTNESNREDAGETVSADRRVDEVLALVREMVTEQTQELLPPDQRALADEINEKVSARVEAGESPEEAVLAELKAHAARLEEVGAGPIPASLTSQGEESKEPDRYSGDGLYL